MSDELEREPISRRDYLGAAGVGSAAAAVAFSVIGMMRLPKPRVLPDVSSVVRLGKPSEFPPGTVAMLPEENVCVIAAEEGISAVSLVCTHLGCIVKLTEVGFDCPCHGSKFDSKGEVLAGPAPRALRWLAVSQAPDGTLLADRAKETGSDQSYQATS
jgi:cytochrome b6-f complex iron-sulfur subunit